MVILQASIFLCFWCNKYTERILNKARVQQILIFQIEVSLIYILSLQEDSREDCLHQNKENSSMRNQMSVAIYSKSLVSIEFPF